MKELKFRDIKSRATLQTNFKIRRKIMKSSVTSKAGLPFKPDSDVDGAGEVP